MHLHSNCRGPRRKREKGPEKMFEDIIAENFPNMVKKQTNKKIVNQVQEAWRIPGRKTQGGTQQDT